MMFKDLNTEIIALGPNGPRAYKKFWEEESIPYIGCSDIGSKIADMYQQEVNVIKFGRMPAEFVIGLEGEIVFAHFGKSMSDIPDPEILIETISKYKKI